MTVEQGLLSDALRASPIASGESSADFEFGVDPNMDPELALALRMSLEEEQAKQQRQAGSSSSKIEDVQMSEEDRLMAEAIAMSMETTNDTDMQDIVTNLPGVDPSDPKVQKAFEDEKKKSK